DHVRVEAVTETTGAPRRDLGGPTDDDRRTALLRGRRQALAVDEFEELTAMRAVTRLPHLAQGDDRFVETATAALVGNPAGPVLLDLPAAPDPEADSSLREIL